MHSGRFTFVCAGYMYLNRVLAQCTAVDSLGMPKRRILVEFEESDTGSDAKRQKKFAVSSHRSSSHLTLNSSPPGLNGQHRY